MQNYLDRADSTGIHTARGSVRDGLAALQNLENLLRSPRIGPRALEKVVGQLRSSSWPIGAGFILLIERIARRGPQGDALRTLSGFARARAERLDEALIRAANSDLGAKPRLALEAEICNVSADFDALRVLVDLMEAATHPHPTELDLDALVDESMGAMSGPKRGVGVAVATHHIRGGATVVTDSRVGIALISLGVGLVASLGARSIEIHPSHDPPTGSMVRLRPTVNGASTSQCYPPLIVEPSLDVAQAAAEQLRASLVVDADIPEVCLGFPSDASATSRDRS